MRNFFALASLGLLCGCGHVSNVEITNTTPRILAANASETYPITMQFRVRSGEVERSSIRAQVVVDGQARKMERDGSTGFFCEYGAPKGRNSVAYYFDVDYTQRGSDGTVKKNIKTRVYELDLSNRYVLGLDTVRGIPGTCVTVMGRGFSGEDQVFLGDGPAETHFESPTTLKFFVPAITAGRSYRVTIEDRLGPIPAGEFRVDPALLNASPRAVELRAGRKAAVALTTAMPAPSDGLDVNITTDIPNAIEVEERHIPEGHNGVSFDVKGIAPATGSLYVAIDGHQTLTMPIVVRE
ncbi:MAG: IPT/TIG domain-containing protein [Puniceicoccales bacterium]|nr:IPT/TIG domain-containing protein [Puniceicoccales bacterium]